MESGSPGPSGCWPFRPGAGCSNRGHPHLGAQSRARYKQGIGELGLGGQVLSTVHAKLQNFVHIWAGISDSGFFGLDTAL